MSYKEPNIYAYKAEAAIALGGKGLLCKFGTADDLVVLSGADEAAIGIIMNETSNVAGECLEIAGSNGGAKVKVAAAIVRGALFKSDAAGKAVVAADRSEALGQIDEAATAIDQLVACVLF